MKVNKKLYSVALASTAIVLFLILILSTASAATAQSTSPRLDTPTLRIAAAPLSL